MFAHKWRNGQHPDVPKLVALAFALGRLGSAGIGVGVSLHDSAIAILRRFARSDYLKDICEQAIRGEAVLCIGASEESGGSDLQIVETEVPFCPRRIRGPRRQEICVAVTGGRPHHGGRPRRGP